MSTAIPAPSAEIATARTWAFPRTRTVVLAAAVACTLSWTAWERRAFTFPDSISAEAGELFPQIYARSRKASLSLPSMRELEDAHRRRQNLEDGPVPWPAAGKSGESIEITRRRIAGTPVIDIRTARSAGTRKVIVFFHGGAFVVGSPQHALPVTAELAQESGLRVVSVGYDLAPFARWQQVTDQALSVVKALRADGHAASDIALVGESAGGNLATVTALLMREKLGVAPASVALWSPWTDLGNSGDTRTTLASAEMHFIAERVLTPAAAFYAGDTDLRHPHVSPVYADFRSGFPPTLIQAGTREVLLSDAVRLHRAIEQAGNSSALDIYEGMPHVFHMHVEIPEARSAIAKTARFVRKNFGLDVSNARPEPPVSDLAHR